MAKLHSLFILFFFFTSSNCQNIPQLVPALYVFGDSTVDGGNTGIIDPAYGMDLNTSIPKRWSNGKTIADYIATFLGLPLVPPSINSQTRISTTGVNYGSAGCGILPQTGGACWSFDVQLTKFKSTLMNDLSKSFNQVDLLQHLKHSIFLISFGINDYTQNYIQPNNGSLKTLVPDVFAEFLLNELSVRLTNLYELGARKFVVNNIWPLGCTPRYIDNQSVTLAICCKESINKLVMPYNDSLPTTLLKLQYSLPGSIFLNTDNFQFVTDLKENVARYGITNTTGSCLSLGFGGTPCTDRDRYLYFDPVHTTQAANYVFSLNCFNGTLCTPRNIIGLVGYQVY